MFFVVVGLTLVGLILVLTATITIPHTVQESFSEFNSYDETREFEPSMYPLGPFASPIIRIMSCGQSIQMGL
jgi:hypothetical protein